MIDQEPTLTTVSVRLGREDLGKLRSMEDVGVRKSEVLRRLIRGAKLPSAPVPPPISDEVATQMGEVLGNLWVELRKEGGNLRQLVVELRKNPNVSAEVLDRVERLHKLNETTSAVLSEFSKTMSEATSWQ